MEFCAFFCFGIHELGGTFKEVVDSVNLTLVNNGCIYKSIWHSLPIYTFSNRHII